VNGIEQTLNGTTMKVKVFKHMEHINGSALVLVALLVWALYKVRNS
jgi:hypothetical protein